MARAKKPSKECAELQRYAQKAFSYTSKERNKFLLSVAYVDGEQWTVPSAGGDGYSRVDMSRYEGDEFPTVSDNELGPAVRSLVGTVATPLNYEVKPLGSDSASRSAARLAERITINMSEEHNWEQLDEELLMATETGGCAAVAQMWNPRKGKGLGVDKRGRSFGSGDLEFFVVDIGEFAVQPGRHVPEAAEWWVLQRALPPSEVKERYGLSEEPSADSGSVSYSTRIDYGRTSENLVTVLSFFQRPCSQKDKGRVATVINNEIVEDVPWPFPYKDKLNISVCRPQPKHRRWTGHSTVWDAIPNQTQLNWFQSYRMAHLRDAANAERLVDESFIDDSVPGPKTIPVAPDPVGGFMPRLMETWQMPDYARDFGPEQRELVRSKIGISDVAMGEVPKGVSAASAFAVLIEQGEKRLSPLVKARSHVWSDAASKALETYEVKVKDGESRELKMVDGDHVRTIEWDGSMLLGHTKVKVPVSGIMPRNRAAAVAMADTLVGIGQVQDARTYLELSGMADADQALGVLAPDWERAKRENHMMASGKACVVEAWDDDAIHIESHTAEFKSERWDEMSEDDRYLARQHVQQHETQAAEKAGSARQQQMLDPTLAAAPQVARQNEGVTEAIGNPDAGPPAPPPPPEMNAGPPLEMNTGNSLPTDMGWAQ